MPDSIHIFLRIAAYARPYWKRLALGVVAGFFVGGSIFGMLSFVDNLMRPFVKPGPKIPVEQMQTPPTPAEPEDAADTAAPEGDGSVEHLRRIARKLQIPAEDEHGRMTWQFLLLTILGLPVFVALKALGTYANRYYMRWVGARIIVDIRNELFVGLQHQSLAFFGRSDVGELISRCTNDTATIESTISHTVSDVTRAPLEIGAAASFILYYAFENDLLGMVLFLLIVFPACVIPIIVMGRFIRRHTRHALRRVSDLVSRMQETFSGIRVVKAYHMENEEARRFVAINDRYFRNVLGALRAQLFMTPLMEMVGVALACAFITFCYARNISLSQIAAMGIAAFLAYKPLKQMAKIQTGLQRSAAAAERIFELLDTDTALKEAPDPIRIDTFRNRIAFENVSFRYDPESPPVLRNVSFEMPKGSVVAFVGETGSGKTTVANLLARFYDPTDGRVLMDGIDLRNCEIASLRRLVGVVTQETVLFNDTIANNIAYGTENASRKDIEEAARKANAHDFIVAEPEGYDRIVGEKGFRLSGGQRQRVAIARAILRNPPILILDEATSALDTVTEQLVQEAIGRVMAERTVFAIAHRLSTIRHADLICLLEDGRIVEKGTHRELYRAGGHYRSLCDMQFS